MKRRWMLMAAGMIVVLAAGAFYTGIPESAAQENKEEEDNPVTKFMRAKLASSQKVVEGLVTEDFKAIQQSADKMIVMSKATEWQVIQGPVYTQYSSEFRRSAEQLAKMAKEKNLDGATLSYLSVTMNCINCHKYVRSVKIAAGEDVPAGFDIAGLQLR